jgi:hypothetical protein
MVGIVSYVYNPLDGKYTQFDELWTSVKYETEAKIFELEKTRILSGLKAKGLRARTWGLRRSGTENRVKPRSVASGDTLVLSEAFRHSSYLAFDSLCLVVNCPFFIGHLHDGCDEQYSQDAAY